MYRRAGILAVAAGFVLALPALAGCTGTPTTDPSASPSATTSTAAPSSSDLTSADLQLSKAATELAETSFQFDLTSGTAKVTGSYDPAKANGESEVTDASRTYELRMLGPDLYARGLPNAPSDKWTHVDAKRLPATHPANTAADPTTLANFLAGAADVQPATDGRYTGTLDVQEAVRNVAGDQRQKLDLLIQLFGDVNMKLPFEADVDGQGRLSRLEVTLPIEVAGKRQDYAIEINYHDFGTPVSVERPPADQVVEATEQTYRGW